MSLHCFKKNILQKSSFTKSSDFEIMFQKNLTVHIYMFLFEKRINKKNNKRCTSADWFNGLLLHE